MAEVDVGFECRVDAIGHEFQVHAKLVGDLAGDSLDVGDLPEGMHLYMRHRARNEIGIRLESR